MLSCFLWVKVYTKKALKYRKEIAVCIKIIYFTKNHISMLIWIYIHLVFAFGKSIFKDLQHIYFGQDISVHSAAYFTDDCSSELCFVYMFRTHGCREAKNGFETQIHYPVGVQKIFICLNSCFSFYNFWKPVDCTSQLYILFKNWRINKNNFPPATRGWVDKWKDEKLDNSIWQSSFSSHSGSIK